MRDCGGGFQVRGGVTFFRAGGGAAARAYLEKDHSRADDYYLAEGEGLAQWFALDGEGRTFLKESLDGPAYEAWVDWLDPQTGEVRGKVRNRTVVDEMTGEKVIVASSPRFAEMTVNVDKTLSIAAALDPKISAALDAAQLEAAQAMSVYMAKNSRTRVGDLGAQELVPVERLEAAVVSHQTSRAGDPHRHIHLQWNTRVFAQGKWRALDTATTLRQQGALRGVGEAAIHSHPRLRAALAEAGMSFDPATGKVLELAPYAETMSKRGVQVAENRDRLEAAWVAAHPGMVPGPALVRAWDRQAWAEGRPEKKPAQLSTAEAWKRELVEAGFRPESLRPGQGVIQPVMAESLDREVFAAEALSRVAAHRSAWSVADLHDVIGHQLAASGVVATGATLEGLRDEITAKAVDACRSISDPRDGLIPDSLRHLTSVHVIAVEDEVKGRFAARAMAGGQDADLSDLLAQNAEGGTTLGEGQRQAVEAMAGTHQLVVLEGAAGAGKTTALKVAKAALDEQGRVQMIVAPTLKAAKEAALATGSDSASLHKLLHANGFRWNENGQWSRLEIGQTDTNGATYRGPAAGHRLTNKHQLVIDEAGMVDQDAARAMLQLADESGAQVVLMGDRAQLAAVGRGGVLDMAAKLSTARVDMIEVHRFKDKSYVPLTLKMRERTDLSNVFDELAQRGQVAIHATESEAMALIAADAVKTMDSGKTVAITVATNDQARELNAAVRERRVELGQVKDDQTATGSDGLAMGRGDLVMNRHNDKDLGLANRELYRVSEIRSDGSVVLRGEDGRRNIVDADYVAANLHLGYAVTDYGNQGGTVHAGHELASTSMGGAGAYVGLTRGREENYLHIVAASHEDARTQFVAMMESDRADRGLDKAREDLAEQIKPYLLPQHSVVSEAQENTKLGQIREAGEGFTVKEWSNSFTLKESAASSTVEAEQALNALATETQQREAVQKHISFMELRLLEEQRRIKDYQAEQVWAAKAGAWKESGRQHPNEATRAAETAKRNAAAAAEAATAAAANVAALQERVQAQVQERLDQTLWEAAAREKAVQDTPWLKRRGAKEEFAQWRESQQMPENINDPAARQEWTQRVEPILEASYAQKLHLPEARAAHQVAGRDQVIVQDRAQALHDQAQQVRAQWQQEVGQRPLTPSERRDQAARQAGVSEQAIEARQLAEWSKQQVQRTTQRTARDTTPEQHKQDLDRAAKLEQGIQKWKAAPLDQQVKQLRADNAAQALAKAEQAQRNAEKIKQRQKEQRHARLHQYQPPTQDRGGPSLGR